MENPLLTGAGLPPFKHIKVGHAEPAIDTVIAENRAALASLLKNAASPDWERTLRPVEDLQDRLSRAWAPVRHLHAVADNDDLRAAFSNCLPKLSDYATEFGQHEGLYNAYRSVRISPEFPRLPRAERKIIENALRDFKLSGVELNGEKKERFRAIKQRLAQLDARFEEHLLDATHGWKKHLTDPASLQGLPASARDLAQQRAAHEGLSGWLLTLELPLYLPLLTFADDCDLRREVYVAYVTRASDQGPFAGRWDNSEIMVEILNLRAELARLLGYQHYAELALVPRMAKSAGEVLGFLEDLGARARPVAERELAELRDFAQTHYGSDDVHAWDLAYYSEKLKQQRYSLSQEDLRPYFPAPRVVNGMFAIVQSIYGLDIRARADVETWHSDVDFYEIYDRGGSLRGGFYLDLYARPHKRGGAWMDECIVRRRSPAGVQIPVAFLTCNFAPPIGDHPALLTHDDVNTLFHEFGHGLHHLLTLVDYPSVAGVNGVPWDAVELPSQLMENWCWEPQALDLISGHHETGAPIDAALYERMHAAKTFQAGMQMIRQLEFALFDFRLHLTPGPYSVSVIQAVLDRVRAEIAVVKPPLFNRFQHGFSHIFAGGYAAGYYSYKWAEVLAADAFSKFQEGGVFDAGIGEGFMQTFLEQGGTREPMEMFVQFRGRKPRIAPLLRRWGLAA